MRDASVRARWPLGLGGGVVATLAVAGPALAQTAGPFLSFDSGAGERPGSVVVDKVGDVSVSRQARCGVRKYSPDGQLLQSTVLVEPCTGGAGSSGLAVDATGLLYAAVKGPEGDTPSRAVAGLPGAVTSVAFGTGQGHRKTLFIALNSEFGGTVSGIYRSEVGGPRAPVALSIVGLGRE